MKLESGNQKIQYGRQAAILKVTSLKINRLLPLATINMHMKFEIEIPKQTWLMLRKPCRLQTDGGTEGRTDRRTDKVNPVYPPPTSLGGGYNDSPVQMSHPLPYISCPVYLYNGIFQNVSHAMWLSDATWQISGSTLAQVTVWCLMTPCHYLNQYQLIITQVQRHLSEGNFTRDTAAINQ